MRIGNNKIGLNHRPFIIAEMSGNHNQSLDRALEIVEAALKLYTTIPKDFTIKKNQTVWVEDEFKGTLVSLNLYGHVILQAIISDKNEVFIIECNPRFGGASTLSVHAGLDSFYWAYLESMKVSIKDYPFIRSQKELTQVRYPQDFYL